MIIDYFGYTFFSWPWSFLFSLSLSPIILHLKVWLFNNRIKWILNQCVQLHLVFVRLNVLLITFFSFLHLAVPIYKKFQIPFLFRVIDSAIDKFNICWSIRLRVSYFNFVSTATVSSSEQVMYAHTFPPNIMELRITYTGKI